MIVDLIIVSRYKEQFLNELGKKPPSTLKIDWPNGKFKIHSCQKLDVVDGMAGRYLEIKYLSINELASINIPMHVWTACEVKDSNES